MITAKYFSLRVTPIATIMKNYVMLQLLCEEIIVIVYHASHASHLTTSFETAPTAHTTKKNYRNVYI